MSDRVVESDHGKDESSDKSMQPFQSAWMSHWKQVRHRPMVNDGDVHNQVCESGENSRRTKHCNSIIGSDKETGSSKFVKEFREMYKAIPHEAGLGTKFRHQTSSKKSQHFPMFKSSQGKDGFLSLMKNSSKSSGNQESQFELEGIISDPNQQVSKSTELLEERRVVISAPVKNEFLGSSSRLVPLDFSSGKTLTELFFPRQDYINQPPSTSLVLDRKINNNAALLMDDPSTSDNRLRDFLSQQIQKMPNHSDFKLFPSQMRPLEPRLYHGSSIHDLESMRICTSIGSVEEFTLCPPKFSQTTHHFLITKKTDANLYNGSQMFGESSVSTKYKGKPPGGILSLSPDYGFNVRQGVKLQPLDSSTDSEAKENIENVHASAVHLTNESSAETDTMDIDTLRANNISGVASSISDKDNNRAQKLQTSEAAIASAREENRGRFPIIELPDINEEVTGIPGGASSADDEEASTSRTQSLDVEHFLPHVKHPTNSKSNACADTSLGLDPYCRWVKRLKPSSSDSFAHGTRSSKMGEASSHEKVNKLFSKILKGSKASSEPKMNKAYGKQHMVVDQTADIPRNIGSSSTDSVQRSQEITPSHAWIRRWGHNQAASLKKKPETVVVHEPQSSKANEDKFQKKQFPSIAAMALMGKAMNGFHPCEFRKRGTFIVWNTKGLK